jgi:hypothetical protein
MSGHRPFADLRDALPPPGRDAYEKMRGELLLIRLILGLNPIHDPVECVRVLHEEGKEAFEKLRGERCEYAHEWKPTPSPQRTRSDL